jgi:hypothetical protein
MVVCAAQVLLLLTCLPGLIIEHFASGLRSHRSSCTLSVGFCACRRIPKLKRYDAINVKSSKPATGTRGTPCVDDAGAQQLNQQPSSRIHLINVMSLSWPGIIFNALAILCPLIMALLSQRPGTRVWKVGIYPLGVICAVLAILSLTDHTRRTRLPGGEAQIGIEADNRYT